MGRALWIFGFLQIASNLGYVLVAEAGPDRGLMLSAVGVEAFTTGLGTGAFFVMLLRLTQKRFSATQYALLTSLMAVAREVVTKAPAGWMAEALGWPAFFAWSAALGIPGLLLLRWVRPGTAEAPDSASLAGA